MSNLPNREATGLHYFCLTVELCLEHGRDLALYHPTCIIFGPIQGGNYPTRSRHALSPSFTIYRPTCCSIYLHLFYLLPYQLFTDITMIAQE